MEKEIEELREKHGGVWGHHPEFTVSGWRHEVNCNDTRLGYWEWVYHQMESEAEDAEQDKQELLGMIQAFLCDQEQLKQPWRNEALCENARAILAKHGKPQ